MFKSHSVTAHLWSHLLFCHVRRMSLKFSGRCSCSICEVSHTLQGSLPPRAGPWYWVGRVHYRIAVPLLCNRMRLLGGNPMLKGECCVHQATEQVVVTLSESSQHCLPPHPLTSGEGYIRKVSEEQAEVLPKSRRCPYTILKRQNKQNTTEVKRYEITASQDSHSPSSSSEVRLCTHQVWASPSLHCPSLSHL